MLQHLRLAMQAPAVLLTLLLVCLALAFPAGAFATQAGQATPIPSDPELQAAASTANFDTNPYTVSRGKSTAVTLTVENETGSTVHLFKMPAPLPTGMSASDLQVIYTSLSTCTIGETVSGIEITTYSDETCQYQITINTTAETPTGSYALSLQQTNDFEVAATTLVVQDVPTFAFDQATYTGKTGTPIEGQFIITTPAGASTSSNITLMTTYSSLPLAHVSTQATGDLTTCTASQDSLFILIVVDSTGAGTCTVAFTIGTDSGHTTDPAIVVSANYTGTVEGTTASQIVIEDPVLTAAFDATNYIAQAGDTFDVTLTMTTDAAISLNPYTVFNPYPGVFEYLNPTVSGSSNIDCGTPMLSSGAIAGSFTSTSETGQVESCTVIFTVRVLVTADTQQAGTYVFDAFVAGIVPGPSATIELLAPDAATAAFDQPAYSAHPGESTTASLTISVPSIQYGGTVIIRNLAPGVMAYDNVSVNSKTGGVTCDLDTLDTDISASVLAISGPGSCTIAFDITANPDAMHGSDGDIEAVLMFQGTDSVASATFMVDDPLTINAFSFHIQPGTGFTGDLGSAVLGGNPPYTFILVTGPAHGTLELNKDGTFHFIANQDATGTDNFTYTVTDAHGVDVTSAAVGQGTVSIIFDPAAPSPTATATETTIAPTATERPIIPGRTPTPTPTSTIGTSGGGTTGGGTVTQLPSTGTPGKSAQSGIALWVLLTMALPLLAGAVITRRRRS